MDTTFAGIEIIGAFSKSDFREKSRSEIGLLQDIPRVTVCSLWILSRKRCNSSKASVPSALSMVMLTRASAAYSQPYRQLDDLGAWSRESFWYGLHSAGKNIQACFKADERDSSERWDSTLLQAFGQMSPNLNSLTIVVVEDNNDVRRHVGAFLDRSGAKVVMARDGHEDLEVVKNTLPDLVLSDITMPGMGGFELLREIRVLGIDAGCSVPVIAMTAFSMSNQRGYLLGAGFQECLPKPFTPNNLLETILRVLDQ